MKPTAGDGDERDTRDAGGDGRFVDREADERPEEDQRADGPPRGAHMPSAEIEIGEQEHEQRRGERRLRTGAPDAIGAVTEPEQLVPEAEVDADEGQNRPRERRRRREDDRALDHEDDGEEEREQARDADDDALVERQAGELVLVGVGLPQIDLRQVRRAQFRDIRDRRAGIERQAEHVGIGAVLALRRKALARRDGGHARRAEIGPDDARADEPEMRRDDQALDLFVRVVRKREDDPRGLRAGLARPTPRCVGRCRRRRARWRSAAGRPGRRNARSSASDRSPGHRGARARTRSPRPDGWR